MDRQSTNANYSGMKIGLIGFLLFTIGGLVLALGVKWLGLPIVIIGFFVGIVGFVFHVNIVLERAQRKSQKPDVREDS